MVSKHEFDAFVRRLDEQREAAMRNASNFTLQVLWLEVLNFIYPFLFINVCKSLPFRLKDPEKFDFSKKSKKNPKYSKISQP